MFKLIVVIGFLSSFIFVDKYQALAILFAVMVLGDTIIDMKIKKIQKEINELKQ